MVCKILSNCQRFHDKLVKEICMAKYLSTTHEIMSEFYKIIDNAEEMILIISPYLGIEEMMKPAFKITEEKKIPISLIYRKESESKGNNSLGFFSNLSNCDIYSMPDLHAKIYANESTAILSSMNIYERKDKVCSIEVGVEFFKNSLEDEVIYQSLVSNKKLILNTDCIAHEKHSIWTAPAFCIKCGRPLEKANLSRPFCKECYFTVQRMDPAYTEGLYCHKCGNKVDGITWNKPMEYDCYCEFIRP